MTKNAYILHGCCDEEEYLRQPSPSNAHWLPWLQKQLLMKGWNCQTPEMPTPYKPSYQAWKSIFESYPVDASTTLIAHSCGCGFLLRWLSETKRSIHKLAMVAPWMDPRRTRGPFLQFQLDPNLHTRIAEMHIFYSADEPVDGVKETIDFLIQTYPKTKLHTFENMGHFCFEEMKTEEFPELLKVVE